jgi:hypothetical protein
MIFTHHSTVRGSLSLSIAAAAVKALLDEQFDYALVPVNRSDMHRSVALRVALAAIQRPPAYVSIRQQRSDMHRSAALRVALAAVEPPPCAPREAAVRVGRSRLD